MQNIFNAVKGKALGVAEYLTPVLKESKFLETGVITPEEFVAAGDHLTHHCPTWHWDAGDPAYARPYLPPNKQFLVTRSVPCFRRIKQIEYMGKEIVVEVGEGTEDEGWVETHGHQGDSGGLEPATEMTLEPAQQPEQRLCAPVAPPAVNEDDNDEPFDMDEFDKLGLQEEDPAAYVAPAPAAAPAVDSMEGAVGQEGEIISTRTYDLHITYDKYYQTPRLWLTGYDESRTPLSVEQMYEDFSEDHANKTITVEAHPHLPSGQHMASVHPCKHAETMKRLCETVTDGGGRLEVHVYLIVFLKFMQAIIPTVEYDFTHRFSL